MNHTKLSYTILFCCSAVGEMLPPMVVYKNKSCALYRTWTEGGPPATIYAATPSGWMTRLTFEQWFIQGFLPWVEALPPEDIKVLIGDNLAAHLSPTILQLCREHNIRFCFLPENSTHFLQPLDVGVFGPMKTHWREILRRWKQTDGKNYSALPKHVSKL